MAWASSGGYPGVVSDGTGGLRILGLDGGGFTQLSGDGAISCGSFSAISVDSAAFVRAATTVNATGGIGIFLHTPPAAATVGGAATAGGTYTATEEAMLNAAYAALRSIGLIT